MPPMNNDEHNKQYAQQDEQYAGDEPNPDDWQEQIRVLADRLLGKERLEELQQSGADLARIGEMAVGGHLDDLRFIEKASFERARRDRAREFATEPNGHRVDEAQIRLDRTGAQLAGLRLARDLANGMLDVSDAEKFAPDGVVGEEEVEVRRREKDAEKERTRAHEAARRVLAGREQAVGPENRTDAEPSSYD